jgi:hypothetical protein
MICPTITKAQRKILRALGPFRVDHNRDTRDVLRGRNDFWIGELMIHLDGDTQQASAIEKGAHATGDGT